MKNSNWKNLILSVGKFHIRVLSPIEVAQHIALAKENGFSIQEISERCSISAPMVSKFTNLLKIREDYWHLIDWGEEGSLISFSTAGIVGRFDKEVQKKILDAKIKYNLNKTEIHVLNQRIDRSGMNVDDCIKEAAQKKQKILINVFVGALFPETIESLKEKLQADKDKLLQEFINSIFPDSRIVAKVGKNEFTLLINDSKVFTQMSADSADLENKINQALKNHEH